MFQCSYSSKISTPFDISIVPMYAVVGEAFFDLPSPQSIPPTKIPLEL
ncbi:MAG: hypothetical protein K2H20_04610 [Bacilli bacterium]|nr:hypothetical protein [Bacilli bacterium]